MVGAGEKYTGVYSVLDARTGGLIQQKQVVPSCPNSNGLFSDSAVAGNVVFVNGENCQIQNGNPLLPTGVVAALGSDASQILWDQIFTLGPVFSGLAVANGVLYFQVSDIPGSIYAVDSESGKVLANLQVSGGISGPSVSRGQVYVGTGTASQPSSEQALRSRAHPAFGPSDHLNFNHLESPL